MIDFVSFESGLTLTMFRLHLLTFDMYTDIFTFHKTYIIFEL